MESAPEQHDQEDDHQYQAKAPAEVVVWRTSVETAPTKKENQNNEKQDQSHLLLLSKWKAQRLPGVDIKADRTGRILLCLRETVYLIWVNVSAPGEYNH